MMMVFERDGKKFTQVCPCGHPLTLFYGVNYNEYGCFKCGNLFSMMGRETTELTEEMEKQDIAASKLKTYFYDEHEDPMSESYFREWVKENQNEDVSLERGTK